MSTLGFLHALRWSGLTGWGALLTTLLLRAPSGSWPVSPRPLMLGAALLYLLSFWRATDITRPRRVRGGWTVVLGVVALLVNAAVPKQSAADALLVAVAGVLPMQYGLGPALTWVAAQATLLGGVLLRSLGAPAALRGACWSLGLQAALAVLMWFVFHHLHTRREAFMLGARIRLATEQTERQRIARDLHDVMGHDLTLLSVELEYARQAPRAEVSAAVWRARAIAGRLFDDVRVSVEALRQAPAGWREILRPLDVCVPGLRVHVAVPLELPPPGPAASRALALAVQEALTNTVRHAGATQFFVQVSREGAALIVGLWDDGRVRGTLAPGHGLTGMRERLAAVGGMLEVTTRPDGSVGLQARVPHPGGAE